MGYDYKELYEKIRDMAFAVRNGIANTAAPMRFVEQAKNVLYNNMDGIEAALKFAADAQDQIKVLELELSDAERELDELTHKTTAKKKPKAEDTAH